MLHSISSAAQMAAIRRSQGVRSVRVCRASPHLNSVGYLSDGQRTLIPTESSVTQARMPCSWLAKSCGVDGVMKWS